MARETRAPEALRELFAALGDDPILIAETLGRGALAERRIRAVYARDSRIHDEVRRRAERALREATSPSGLRSCGARYRETTWRPEGESTSLAPPGDGEIVLDGAAWERRLASLPAAVVGELRETDGAFESEIVLERGPDLVRTASFSWAKVPFDSWWAAEVKVAGADPASTGSAAFRPVAVAGSTCVPNTWVPTSTSVAPFRRAHHTAVWTGAEMIVWGGWEDEGGRYNPGAAETCNGLDDDCDEQTDEDAQGIDSDADGVRNACDNCRTDYNPSQSNADQDGEGDYCDPDDGMIFVVSFEPGYIEWMPETGAVEWNVYEGDLDVLRSSGAYTQPPASNPIADRHCGVTQGPWVDDPDAPPVGKTKFALVTIVTAGTESSLGFDSSGTTRPNAAPCP